MTIGARLYRVEQQVRILELEILAYIADLGDRVAEGCFKFDYTVRAFCLHKLSRPQEA